MLCPEEGLRDLIHLLDPKSGHSVEKAVIDAQQIWRQLLAYAGLST